MVTSYPLFEEVHTTTELVSNFLGRVFRQLYSALGGTCLGV